MPAQANLVHGFLEGGEHKALVTQIRRQGPVVEAAVALLVPQGEGLGELIHLCCHVRLQPLGLAPAPPLFLLALLDGFQKLAEESTESHKAWEHCAPGALAIEADVGLPLPRDPHGPGLGIAGTGYS